MASHLEACPALVLNADFRPLSYFPLSLWHWQDAVKAVFLDRVNIVEEYEREVHAPGFSMKLPSVIALKNYVTPQRKPAFTRFNLFLRDRFDCQYCGQHFSSQDLTFDHVIPRSRGGRTTWENVVAACAPCNLRKANRMPKTCGMHPLHPPHAPTAYELQDKGRNFPPAQIQEDWDAYLYWNTELEA